MKTTFLRFLFWSLLLSSVVVCLSGCAPTKPLVMSAGMGDIEAVKNALKRGADVNVKDKYGSTALHDASFTGNEKIVRLLLENGADINIRGGGGMTALHYAAEGIHINVVKLLLDDGADINLKSDVGLTPLHIAATKDSEKFTRFLINNGADVHAKDSYGQTALHKASIKGTPGVVMSLIGAGSKIDITDRDGNTPIFIARENVNSQVVLILENEYMVQGIALNYAKSLVGKDNKQQDLGNIADIGSTKLTSIKTNMSNPDGIAVIIGTKSYDHKDIPDVLYAKNDAEAMRMFLIKSLGYKDGNIIFDVDPTKAELEMIFGIKGNHKGILHDYIKPNKSDVFIYFSGHGAPDVNTNKAYFVPKNGNPNKIAFTGYPLDTFYENISQLPAKKMTVVIEACFSGGTDSGRWIVSNASPALIKITNPVVAKQNIAILTSSESSQISSWYPDKKHGLFTYFFLRAVNGDADKDKNRKITYREIFDYVSDRTEGVPYWAKRLHGGRVQIPTVQIMNDHDVFISY